MKKENNGNAARATFIKEDADRRADNAAAAREEEEKNRPPVVCLGRVGEKHALYSTAYRRVECLTAEKMSLPNLRNIAPRDKWEAWLFPERVAAGDAIKKSELVEAAQERLIAESGAKMFDSSCIRSRGVWDDSAGGWLYNAGAACWHISPDGGKVVKVDNVRGLHVYAVKAELPRPDAAPLTDAEGRKLVTFLTARPWSISGAGELIAGWTIASMLAGCMPFCPHVWINAPAGTGKTYLKNDLSLMLGKFSLIQEGVPTEAGIRQGLNGDALPVLLDEVEQGESELSGRKISKLLDLMRSASYGKDPVTKGSADGTPRLYLVKCGFALFSIANAISRDADSSRCLVLQLQRVEKSEQESIWREQEAGRELVQTPGFHSRLIARLLAGLPVLKKNIAALTAYLRDIDGVDARRGELFAVLMACRYALASSAPLTKEQMQHTADILRAYGEQEESENDSSRCLYVLLNHQVDVHSAGRMSVQEACRLMSTMCDGETKDYYSRALQLVGLHWSKDDESLRVDPRAVVMKRIYKDTQWSNGKIAAVLAEGAIKSKGTAGANPAGIYYKSERLTRGGNPVSCIYIPNTLIF